MKVVNEGKETNIPWRRTPNNLCKYSALKEREYNSPFLMSHLHILISFQRVQYEKGEKIKPDFTLEPDKQYVSQVIKVNININKSCG